MPVVEARKAYDEPTLNWDDGLLELLQRLQAPLAPSEVRAGVGQRLTQFLAPAGIRALQLYAAPQGAVVGSGIEPVHPVTVDVVDDRHGRSGRALDMNHSGYLRYTGTLLEEKTRNYTVAGWFRLRGGGIFFGQFTTNPRQGHYNHRVDVSTSAVSVDDFGPAAALERSRSVRR